MVKKKQPRSRRETLRFWFVWTLSMVAVGAAGLALDWNLELGRVRLPQDGEDGAGPAGGGWWALAATALALVAVGVGLWAVVRSTEQTREKGVSDRADEAREHLSAASRLLNELGDELAVRIRLLEQHQADAERYEQLASLNSEQAKAIEGLVGRQFQRQSRMTWMQFGASMLAAFVLGLVVNWISQPALAWLTGS